MAKILLASFIVLILSGCAKSLSSAVATSEIYASFHVKGDSASSIECKAVFRVGGVLGTYLELDGEDKVVCSDGTKEIPLAKTTDILGIVEYTATGLTYEVGRTYSVIFRRKGGETHTSTAVLPTAVVITAPTAGSNQKKGDPLNVAWTAATSNGMNFTLAWESGGKSGSTQTSDSDDGAYPIPGTSTTTVDGEGATVTGNVPGTLTLLRYVTGTHTTTLKGGSIEGQQQKAVAIVLVD